MQQLGPPTVQTYASTTLKVSQKLGKSWVKRHWFDLVLLCVLPTGWLLFRYVSRQNFPHGQSRQVVVSSSSGLLPFRVINSSDVAMENVKTITGSLGKLDEVIGHYPVQELSPRAVVQSSQLSAKKIDSRELAGRQAVVIPVRLGPLAGTSKFPLRVSLLFSPKTAATKPMTIPDAYLLATSEVNGTTYAITAVTPEQLKSLVPLIGASDIVLSLPIP